MSTSSQFAFAPLGQSHLIVANVTAPTPVRINVAETTTGVGQYRIINTSSNIVFLGVGSTAAQATANSVAPTVGSPTKTIVLASQSVAVLRFINNAFVTATASSASNVFIVPGQGI